MKAHQKTEGATDVWGTPEWIMAPLGRFDLDPCGWSHRQLPGVARTISLPYDGLLAEWRGRIWLNPPFNRYQRPQWMRRMAEHNNGIMLIPAACETLPFHLYVFGRAAGILMLNKRPHFVGIDGVEAKANSGCTICLVAYGRQNLDILRSSGLGTVLTEAA